MSASRPLRRPTRMRIDPETCQHGGLCRLLAPDLVRGGSVPVTPATLAAMAECPSGALRWCEPHDAGTSPTGIDGR